MPKKPKHRTPAPQHDTLKLLTKKRDNAFRRFPLVFTLLGTFGVVSTFYGFQHLIDKVPILANNPIYTLVIGVVVLLFTGTLYKKL